MADEETLTEQLAQDVEMEGNNGEVDEDRGENPMADIEIDAPEPRTTFIEYVTVGAV
jgi:hypothetical protein